jgi:hypothetical protein
MLVNAVSADGRRRSEIGMRRLLVSFFWLLVATGSTIGLVAFGGFGVAAQEALKDAANELPVYLTRANLGEVKDVLFYAATFWFLSALSFALARLKIIGEIIREFNKARGPIWDMRQTISDIGGTVTNLRGTVTDLNALEPVIKKLGEQMALLDARVESARKQVAELQIETVSNRTGTSGDDSSHRTIDGVDGPSEATDDQNWEILREYWRRNTRRLEYVIEQIEDGRSRLAFDRLPRTNYVRIIDKLEGGGLINAAAANASRDLVSLFNSYRPRTRNVANSVIGTLKLLDRQLDQELVDYAKIDAGESSDLPPEPRPPIATKPPVRPNGRGDQPELPVT